MQMPVITRCNVLFLLLASSITLCAQNNNVGIGTATPDPSAKIEIQSNDQGVLIPRMTSVQRTMINEPATGLLVYQTDGQIGFWFFDATEWQHLSGGPAGPVREIADSDEDTKVQVDEGDLNDNTIRFDVNGQEVMTIDSIVRMNEEVKQLLVGTTLDDGFSRIQAISGQTAGRAVAGTTTGNSGIGVYGTATNASVVTNYGGQFNADGTHGVGVSGLALGVMGRGVYGIASNASAATNYGGYFWANGFSGRGIYAEATGTEGRAIYGNASNVSGTVSYGGYFSSSGSSGYGAYGNAEGEDGVGLRGFASGESGRGVFGTATGTSGNGVFGQFNNASATFGNGGSFSSNGINGRGVLGTAFGESGSGVYGVANNSGTTELHYGGYFEANGENGIGVFGYATNSGGGVNVGGTFTANGALGIGVRGIAHAAEGYAVYGISTNGWAGRFSGKVYVQEQLVIGNFGNIFLSEGANLISFRGTFTPFFDASYDLGSSAKRWKDIYASNNIIQTSDARLKKEIRDIPYGLAEILALRPVTYRWKESDDNQQKLGLLAQEAGLILPEVVQGLDDPDPDAIMGITYAELIPVLIRAIQELSAEVNALRSQQ